MSEPLETFLARFDEIGKNQFIWGGSGSAGQDVRYAASVIRQQRMTIAELTDALDQLHNAAEQMRHGGYLNSLIAAYDGWAQHAAIVLAKHKGA